MARRIPADAGFFRVIIRCPGDRAWCEETHEAFDRWMGSLAASPEHSRGLGAMPSVRVAETGAGYAELVLEWVHQPAAGPWEAVEGVIDGVAKAAFPDLLLKTDELHISVERESRVGRDVEFSDEELRELERRAERSARAPDFPPDD